MPIPSARSKRADQKRMSQPEFNDLPNFVTTRKILKSSEKSLLNSLEAWWGVLAIKRLRFQAKCENISPLEKLCRLYRKKK